LYSPLQYHDQRRASVDLQLAAYAPPRRSGDVGYGFGRFGEEFDWFDSLPNQNKRSVILDLGKHAWGENFTVPWVEPLAKLKPGERRQVFVDTSGADGKDGSPGYGAGDGDGLSALPSTGPDRGYPTAPPRRPKSNGEIRTSPNMLRAVLKHIYVIHVVDDTRDFYALFRVDALERGDNCTISWKLIPPPPHLAAIDK
jgi:hypothetical protein